MPGFEALEDFVKKGLIKLKDDPKYKKDINTVSRLGTAIINEAISVVGKFSAEQGQMIEGKKDRAVKQLTNLHMDAVKTSSNVKAEIDDFGKHLASIETKAIELLNHAGLEQLSQIAEKGAEKVKQLVDEAEQAVKPKIESIDIAVKDGLIHLGSAKQDVVSAFNQFNLIREQALEVVSDLESKMKEELSKQEDRFVDKAVTKSADYFVEHGLEIAWKIVKMIFRRIFRKK